MKASHVARALTLAAAMLPAALGGCSNKDEEEIRAVVKQAREAMLAGDGQAFTDCFAASKDEKKLLAAFCELGSAKAKFDEAMTQAYGAQAVPAGQAGRGRRGAGGSDHRDPGRPGRRQAVRRRRAGRPVAQGRRRLEDRRRGNG